MTTLLGIVHYRLAGLPATVVSAVPVEASVRQVEFGRLEGQSVDSAQDGMMGVLQRWWADTLTEPSLRLVGHTQVAEAPVASSTALVETDQTLAQAARCVAFIRALAEQVPLRDLPGLEHTLVVGTFQPDGTLVCPEQISATDIRCAFEGSGARTLLGPFDVTDPAFGNIQLRPVHTLDEVLQYAFGQDPLRLMRLVCEWLVLCAPSTQGAEAELWHETERRAAEHLCALKAWFQEIGQHPPRSHTLKAALRAMVALAKYQTGEDVQAPEHTLAQLEHSGYHLTAVWLLTRWSFLLRERRYEADANRCLERAAAIQAGLPITAHAPLLPHQIGRSLYYQGRFAEALEKYWHGYRLLERASSAEEQLADFYNSAGKCFNDTYQFSMALELFERARLIRMKNRQDEKLARTYGAMGETYWRLGKLEDAQRCYQENLKLSLPVDQARNERREEMRGSNYLAHIFFAKGQLKEAEELYQKTKAYYWGQYEAGARQELSNLVYSIEGVVRVAAAQGRWDEVKHCVEDTFAVASYALSPSVPEVLPVALLGYVDALRLAHLGDGDARRSRLAEVERLLSGLYPVERAMVMIEQAIGEIKAWGVLEAGVYIERAQQILATFFAIADQPTVAQTFIPIRRAVADGSGALGQEGKDLIAADGQRWETLEGYFASARRHGEVGQADMVIGNLRKIQESVVFFRDILRRIRVE